VEGSTNVLHELGQEAYAEALAEHRRIVREALQAHGGVEVDTQGDAFFIAFPTAPAGLQAASDARERMRGEAIKARMGIHTGSPLLGDEGYVGVDVHRASRIAACGHGGQVLVSVSTAALVGVEGLRDLGEHRLKDLSAPERIFQLGDDDFPPLKSLHQSNLPIPATPFIGRAKELQDLSEMFRADDVRLLTLTGPGGTGKTRLALQAAGERASAHPQGVWWVPLASLRDAGLVLETAAQAVGARNTLAEHIGDKSMLILFDNFEHVIRAAPELATLLAACPNLNLMVTSRELLRLPGEHAYPVPPLEVQEGINLFVERARARVPGFAPSTAVSELCSQLENLPLALELAAARVGVLSLQALVERLSQRLDLLKAGRGVDPRQQTLRATIEWSHELLDQDEQRLFARLAVFAGGCTLESAENVCDADIDTLQSLVDKSLVRVREGDRFWMLETIREFANERLEDSGEAAELRRRHDAFFLALAEEGASEVIGAHPRAWLERLEPEHDNLRAALDRFHETGDVRRALELAGALWGFWQVRGHFAEGRRWLDDALTADAIPTATRARALLGWVSLATETAPVEQTRARAGEALRIYDSLGDTWGSAFSRWRLGGIAATERDWETARDILEQSRQEFRAAADEHHFLAVTRGVAWVNEELGDIVRYRELVQEYLTGARAIGDERLEARGVGARAWWAMEEGRLDDALLDMKRSYEIDRGLGFSVFLAVDLVRFAAILVRQGRASEAAQLIARSDLLATESGAGRESWMQKERDDTLAVIRAQLSNAELEEALGRGRKLTVGEAAALAIGETHASSK
jgi:predicted ATPase